MNYTVELFKRVNELEFGMSKDAVRQMLGAYTVAGKRDMFAHCFAEYADDKLISVEIFGDFTVEIGEVTFRSSDNLKEVGRKMLLLDPEAKLDPKAGASSRKLSIGTYFENGFECILIGRENYYR